MNGNSSGQSDTKKAAGLGCGMMGMGCCGVPALGFAALLVLGVFFSVWNWLFG